MAKKSFEKYARRLLFSLLLGCMASLWMYGQNRIRVEGFVSDESGEPLIGATVMVKGTTQGTITGINGDFTLTVPAGSVLQISSIGYETESVSARQGKMEITLKEQSVEVDEVVVVAYGTAKKSTFTGSALAVSSEQISKTPASNPAAALQGMSAGVSVVNNMGDPAADPLITIRGVGSIRAATAPLYVVDGVPYDGSLNAIAPSDIESMTVLKDAAASSLYGSRAANGVVMITTRKAKLKKAVVSLNTNWGYSELAVPLPKVMDPGTFYEYQWEAFYNDRFYVAGDDDATARQYATDHVIPYLITVRQNSKGENVYVHPYNTDTPVGTDGKLKPDAKLIWDPADYDWPGAYLQKNLRQEYNASVSGMGNNEDLNYMFSASYLDDKGFTKGQLFNRYTFRSNITNRINSRVTVGLNMSYTHSRQNYANDASTRFLRNMQTYVSPWLRNTDNTDWVYSEKTGERMLDFGYYRKEWGGTNNFANALATDTDNDGSWNFRVTYRDVISARSFMEADLMKGLKFRTNLSLDNTNRKINRYSSAVHGSAQSGADGWGVTILPSGGTAYKTATRQTSTTWNNLLTYETEFSKVHHLNLLLGHELYARNYEYFYGYRNGIMLANLYELNNASGSSYGLESYRDTYRLLSFFGRAEYNYADKYYLSASYRQDGSSRFSENSRWGGFFSAGASWRLSQEEFIRSIEWINNISLRASYGTTGNDNLLDSNNNPAWYAYQGTFEAYNLYGNAGVRRGAIPTPDLIWEKNRQLNAGVDFRLFGNLSGTVEYFDRSSEDLLYYRDLPLSGVTGAATGYNTNMGDVVNRGLEISLNYTPVRSKHFSWNVDANVTLLKNTVTSLPDGDYTFTASGGSYYLMREGGSRYDLIAPRYAGVDPQTGNALYWKKIFNEAGEETGREKTSNYAEVSSTSQMDVIGTAIPKIYGAVTNTFTCRDFDFSFMLYYSLGSWMYDHMYVESQTMRLGFSLVEDFVENRWQKPGDVTDYPRLTVIDYTLTRKYTDKFIFKNDFLRLRNISLGYSLPKNLLRKAGITNARLFVTGVNLLTWGPAASRGTDPEIQADGSAYNGSNANGALGTSKSVSGGIQLTF
jgi:TonB-linked SusC/RagA family outer membrane protein